MNMMMHIIFNIVLIIQSGVVIAKVFMLPSLT